MTRCKKYKQGRQNIKQLKLVVATVCSFAAFSYASERSPTQSPKKFSEVAPTTVKTITRLPASFTPDVEIQEVPPREGVWLENVWVEDQAGVMTGMRNTLESWDREAEYARTWNLESTGLYVIKDQNDRKSYFNKNLLKYVDKRLSGEIKQAEKGSTLARVGQAQKALTPNAEVGVSESVKIKFKAKILQAKAFMIVKNDYLENSTEIDISGNLNINVSRDIASLGVNAGVNYHVTDGQWVATVDKKLSEHWRTRLSSSQVDSEMAFSKSSDTRMEFMFTQPF